jgi:hypothetical protein
VKVAVCCEFSGTVREAFKAKGHDAWSCDLLPTEIPGQHHVGDAVKFLDTHGPFDLAICHPPCFRLCNSGVRWLYGGKGKVIDPKMWAAMEDAAAFFRAFLEAPVPRIAVENPIPSGHALTLIGQRYTQIVQPYHFGHKEMKSTALWLKGLPPLIPTDMVGPPPKDRELRKHWAKVHRASPGPNRWKVRSKTYAGLANAMAEQWGALLAAPL